MKSRLKKYFAISIVDNEHVIACGVLGVGLG
jgi:hypothetical protein